MGFLALGVEKVVVEVISPNNTIQYLASWVVCREHAPW